MTKAKKDPFYSSALSRCRALFCGVARPGRGLDSEPRLLIHCHAPLRHAPPPALPVLASFPQWPV